MTALALPGPADARDLPEWAEESQADGVLPATSADSEK
jgi:hypothetical protein